MPAPLPTADELADTIGLTHSNTQSVDYQLSRLQSQMGALLLQPSFYRRKCIMAEFSAKYLVSLVHSFLETFPELLGGSPTGEVERDWLFHPSSLLLFDQQITPYFVKFLLSTHPCAAEGDKIAPRFAERYLHLLDDFEDRLRAASAAERDETYIEIASTIRFLYRVLVLQIDKKTAEPIPDSTVWRLGRFLRSCVLHCTDEQAHKELNELGCLLLPRTESLLSWVRAARDTMEGMQQCALPGCTAQDNLLQCARCRTVLYCTRAHQRDHWHHSDEPHKEICFKTQY